MQTIGTCSLCGGEVRAPVAWWSVVPYVPTCSRCGAIAAQHGPVIPMVRPAHVPTPCVDREWEWWLTRDRVTLTTAGTIAITLSPDMLATGTEVPS